MSLLLVLSMKSVRASFGVLVWWADARVRSGWAASSPLNGRVYDQSLHYALWPAAARPLCSVTSYGMPRDDQRGLNEACPASYFEPGFCWQVTLFYEVVVVVCVGRKSRIENLSSNNGCNANGRRRLEQLRDHQKASLEEAYIVPQRSFTASMFSDTKAGFGITK